MGSLGAQVKIDRSKPLAAEPATGHNRWHPDIEPILSVKQDEEVILETRDALDGMITENTTPKDLAAIEMGRIHPLTGPIFIEGANPGDLLEVDILDVRPQPFGFTLLIPGFGILRDYFPDPYIATWAIAGQHATSPQLPGLKIPGAPFMGVMGVAPSYELLDRIRSREAELHNRGGVVILPGVDGAVPNNPSIAASGLRTIPPRENGGNLDIRQLTVGAKVYLPVFVPGALFSAGDAHFAQGDCESCGTAIEMGATLKVRFKVHAQRATASHMRGLHFERSGGLPPRMAAHGPYYATTGMPISPSGQNESEDVTLAAKNALLSMIDYLVVQRGLTREQAYVVTSVAVDLSISELVDVPNVLVSAFLASEIFIEG
jgi:formamidase